LNDCFVGEGAFVDGSIIGQSAVVELRGTAVATIKVADLAAMHKRSSHRRRERKTTQDLRGERLYWELDRAFTDGPVIGGTSLADLRKPAAPMARESQLITRGLERELGERRMELGSMLDPSIDRRHHELHSK
jgi:hypothetical protein